MTFTELPHFAAWEHRDARRGFEVAFFRSADGELRVEGETAAVEGADAWAVRYSIGLDTEWRTVVAHVFGRSAHGPREVQLRTDAAGRWDVNGERAPDLDGCMDVELESSALTNAFPAHRLRLAVGEQAEAPAAYVRATDLGVERLEQSYLLLDDDGSG